MPNSASLDTLDERDGNADACEWTPLRHVSVGGVRVATASRDDLTGAFVADCRGGRSTRPRLVFDSNGHAISSYARDAAYREAMDAADVIHADGGFVVLASRWLAAGPIGDRSGTTDLIHDFARAAEDEGLSFYLLGGTEQVNSECVARMRAQYPRLKIVGHRHGYFRPDEEEDVLRDLAKTDPDVLWVGLGKPREQTFCVANADRISARWVVTCGGCFNYIRGDYGRAPKWMQDRHLEWLYRALTEPRRLLWRYLTTSPHAIWRTVTRIDRGLYPSAKRQG